MTSELKRLTDALGAPDFQLREIQREQRVLDAASRWPILKDVAPEYAPASRPINVNLGQASQPAPAAPASGIVRLQTKAADASAEAAPAPAAGKTTIKGQLSNVFLRLKRDKAKDGKQDGDKIAIV